ncbi:MAG: response regulator [Bacteroidetes bacterium]|nr:response regulator [Bacteroidota bacterium]MBK8657710.1 response regulator [Bacteroidota bacterium]
MTETEILLVEDNAADARLTAIALEDAQLKHKIVLVRDGSEALDYFFPAGEQTSDMAVRLPKVVFLDLKMPKVNGNEVLARLKQDERTRKIPVVMFTSSQEPRDIKECYALGANSYIVKPVDFDEFSKVVSNMGHYWTLDNLTID